MAASLGMRSRTENQLLYWEQGLRRQTGNRWMAMRQSPVVSVTCRTPLSVAVSVPINMLQGLMTAKRYGYCRHVNLPFGWSFIHIDELSHSYLLVNGVHGYHPWCPHMSILWFSRCIWIVSLVPLCYKSSIQACIILCYRATYIPKGCRVF